VSTAVLSIGSNLGDPLAHLRSAVDQLSPWLQAVSPVYRTPPWGPVAQDDYLNAIVIVSDLHASPEDWLQRGQKCEQESGRVRDIRWGARTLDVDVITVDDVIRDDPELTLPHPRAYERAFVLVPWLAIDPDALLPGRGSVADLLAAMGPDEIAGVLLCPQWNLADRDRETNR
jgi:2-amino-4-hydroxy-6-hydroxymethyldihydropteridine diphosphokinase